MGKDKKRVSWQSPQPKHFRKRSRSWNALSNNPYSDADYLKYENPANGSVPNSSPNMSDNDNEEENKQSRTYS